jgi:hypothetical protein
LYFDYLASRLQLVGDRNLARMLGYRSNLAGLDLSNPKFLAPKH